VVVQPLHPDLSGLTAADAEWFEGLASSKRAAAAGGNRAYAAQAEAEAAVLTLAVEIAQDAGAETATEKALAHQLAAAHRLSMGLFAAASRDLHRHQVAAHVNPGALAEAARTAAVGARVLSAFAQGALALDRLRNGNRQIVVVQRTTVNKGGQAVVAGTVTPGVAPAQWAAPGVGRRNEHSTGCAGTPVRRPGRASMRRLLQAHGPVLPRSCDAQRALPTAWRAQHGRPHGGGQGVLPGCGLAAWQAGRCGPGGCCRACPGACRVGGAGPAAG